MNNKPTALQVIGLIHEMGFDEALKRLTGVQGPEQGLVGDVAERITEQGPAKVGLPGERGVGEIAGAVELREHVERKLAEARQTKTAFIKARYLDCANRQDGKVAALSELLEWLDGTDTKRSDLSNS